MRVRYLKESDASAAHHSGDELGSVSDKSFEILSAHATWARTTLKRIIICNVVTIMDNTNLLSKDPESLLASDSEDEELYVPTRRKLARRITISAALTIVNAAVLLATMVLWLSSSRYDGCLHRPDGAGDVQDAFHAHAIEYEVRSYSKPLEYDEVSQKAVIASNGDRNYVGPPSLETDAAWSELLRGMSRAIPLCPLQMMGY